MLTQGAYLTVIGMGTAVLLLLVLIASILLTKYVSNKIDPPFIPPTSEQKEEIARMAKAAAVAVAYHTLRRHGQEADSET
ncbi:MAG: OadG family transporter subunit [Chloroflexota bacterium]|nr:OadG family transporter subunit [Chloroflexota bacterium]